MSNLAFLIVPAILGFGGIGLILLGEVVKVRKAEARAQEAEEALEHERSAAAPEIDWDWPVQYGGERLP